MENDLCFLTLFAQLTYVNVLHWKVRFYYYGFLVNEGICLMLVIQTFYPSSLSVLYSKDVYPTSFIVPPTTFHFNILYSSVLYETRGHYLPEFVQLSTRDSRKYIFKWNQSILSMSKFDTYNYSLIKTTFALEMFLFLYNIVNRRSLDRLNFALVNAHRLEMVEADGGGQKEMNDCGSIAI